MKIFLLVASSFFSGGVVYALTHRAPNEFNQATAVFVCNESVGVIVTKPDGTSDFLKFDDPAIDKIDKKKRNLLALGGEHCQSKQPKTY